jgi:glycosyltransferase involved in cell wall biosynthesis
MPDSLPRVTAILVAQPRSGARLTPTLNSVHASLERACPDGAWEVIVVRPGPDDELRREVEAWGRPCREIVYPAQSVTADFGTLRNEALALSRGEFVTFAEAGDVVSPGWVASAIAACGSAEAGRFRVIHPELTILYGDGRGYRLVAHPDQRRKGFDGHGLVWGDYWGPNCLLRREAALACRFPARVPGFERDAWRWNCDVIATGGEHRVARGTAHFVPRASAHARDLVDGDWRRPVFPSPYFNAPLPRGKGMSGSPPGKLPPWLRRELPAAVGWEPDIGAEARRSRSVQWHRFDDGADTALLLRLAEKLGRRPDYLFAVHQLRRGGAELEALLHVRGIRAAAPGCRISFLITEHSDSEWADRLPADVPVVNFPREAYQAGRNIDQDRLMQKLLLVLEPRRIHLKHSRQVWEAYLHCGEALAARSGLYASLYCVDYDGDGLPTSFAYSHLRHCAARLRAVFCDNHQMAAHLRETCGVTNARVLSFPTLLPPRVPVARKRERSRRLRVLWASRIARQKNVGVVMALSELLRDDEFHVFGEYSAMPAAQVRRWLTGSSPNVRYFGPFDGLDSLDVAQYDVLLYTARWDGLPNILLEAAALGLPVIAPAVGGIPELIDDSTGFLVRKPQDYLTHLERMRRHPAEAVARARALQARVAERHSMAGFLARLRESPGYLEGSA